MATPAAKLAQALNALKVVQPATGGAIRASDLSRVDRECLLKNGFIREVMKGWYMPGRPDQATDAAPAWYASFWSFCASYLTARFGKNWCLGAEQSIALHVGNWDIPPQLLVRATRGGNKPTKLLHDTSIFDLRLELPTGRDMEVIEGLRLMRLPAALIACAPGHFAAQPVQMRAALAMITEATELCERLHDGGHSSIAGRLAGAFRNIGRNALAQTIIDTMKKAGYTVTPTDPFVDHPLVAIEQEQTSPVINRLRLSWANLRSTVLQHFPPAPGLPHNVETYLQQVEAVYAIDAYHSLSLEGYRVNTEQIEQARTAGWTAISVIDDEDQDALAARGYWQAFQQVKATIGAILQGANAGQTTQTDHNRWYRDMLGPSVKAGILKPADLAGYRRSVTCIPPSRHVPPGSKAVRTLMPALFDLLREEKEASVRVVLGHFFFVQIQPLL